MPEFGLIGRNIAYSFSRNYFREKFEREKLNYSYVNFDIENIEQLPKILQENQNLKGMNVTIPYKQAILPYLDQWSKEAQAIGAVNTIKVTANGELVGHNTDYYGFQQSLKPLLEKQPTAALILGTGGASKAIEYALKDLGIKTQLVSRTAKENSIAYKDITKNVIEEHLLIINTTPLGTYPNIESFPDIPYSFLTSKHLLYDLTYNPEETMFMQKAQKYNAKTSNGYQMLIEQAEKSWEIWNVK